MRLVAAVLVLALGLSGPASPPAGAAPASQAPAPPTIAVTTAEVAVDLVVRDKKGRIVRDLKPSDLEVYEDGVRQVVTLFELVTTATTDASAGPPTPARPSAPLPSPPAPSAPQPAPDVEREAVLALVFDRLSPAARRSAHDAALEWVKRPAVRGRAVSVFRIDRGIEQLLPFTDDRAPLIQALDDVVDAAPTAFSGREDRERIRTLRQQIALIEGRVASPGGPLSAADSDVPMVAPDSWRRSGAVKEVARRQLASELAMLQALESLERDQQGLATTNALLALVSGLKTLPGRKAVVFFSEGLVLPDRVVGTLASVIAEANRGGVSFYAADAAGLRTRSAADETRRELVATADAVQAASESDTTLGARPGLTRMLERNEELLRLDPASGLGALARETGGFLIRDTNDMAGGLSRVEEELGAYYLLAYSPRNETWDGGYRRIEVKARRGGLTVQARRGYFAVRTPTPTPVLEHEAPALASLESRPHASDLPVRVRALAFPGEDGDTVISIAAEVPGSGPLLRPDKAGGLEQDFTVLALVRDASGRVVHKSSSRYALAWPKSKTGEALRGRALFDRDTVLWPGRYMVEIVAHDALAGRSGVARTVVDARPAPPGALRVSSLTVVGHGEKRALGEPSPLQYEGVRLFPTFGEPVRTGTGQRLAFVLTLRGAGGNPPREATVELLRGADPVRSADVPLPRPDEGGEIRLVSGLSIAELAPGPYRLRVVVSDGRSMESRTADVTLAP